MKKYISILLAAILSVSLLAGCGGSDNSGQKPAEETQEQAAQPEGTEQAQPEGTEQAQPSEDAAQADAAQDNAQAADNTANSGAYLVFVMDAETIKPIPNVRVQFCSDSACRMGKTDENGLVKFEVDPGTYTVHMMMAPEGYVKSEEEFTLDKDNREATYYLSKEGTEAEPAEAADNKSAESDSVIDFPLAGFGPNRRPVGDSLPRLSTTLKTASCQGSLFCLPFFLFRQ